MHSVKHLLLLLALLGALLLPPRAFCQKAEVAASLITRARTELEKGDSAAAADDFFKAAVADPKCVDAYYEGARVRYADYELEVPLYLVSNAIALMPDFAQAYALRGCLEMAATRQGEIYAAVVYHESVPLGHADAKWHFATMDDALADFSKAIALKPDFADAYNCRGVAKYHKGDTQGAIDDFTKAVALKPGMAVALANLGHAKLAIGDTKGALADLDKAVALKLDFAVALGNRALAKQCNGDLPGALADVSKAIVLDPKYGFAYEFRRILRKAMGDEKGAGEDSGKVWELGMIAITGEGMAVIYFIPGAPLQQSPVEAGRYVKISDHELVEQTRGGMDFALADLMDARIAPVTDPKLKPAFAKAYHTFGRGGWDQSYLDRVIELQPDFPGVYDERGLERRLSNDLDGALADFNKAVALKPDDAAAYRGRGLVKQANGDSAGALADFDRAVALAPGDVGGYSGRALVKQALGDVKGAQADAIHGADIKAQQAKTAQDTAWALYQRGGEKQKWKDTAGAMRDFTHSIAATQPAYAPGYWGRAGVEYGKGDLKAAMDDLNAALAIAPLNTEAQYLHGMIERDKGDKDAALEDFKKVLTQSNDHNALREAALLEQDKGHSDIAWNDFLSALNWQLSTAFGCADGRDIACRQTEASCLDGMQSDLDKAAAFKGARLEGILNGIAGNRYWSDAALKPDEYTALIAVRPGMAALYFIRGNLYFNQHAFPLALADFRKALELGNMPAPSLDAARFFIWVIRAQTGDEKTATGELQAWLDNRKRGMQDGWHAQIARFLTGNISETGFFKAAAGDSDPGGQKAEDFRKTIDSNARPVDAPAPAQMCEAYFYAGAKRLAAGDKTAAKDYFLKAAQTQDYEHIEFNASSAELALLKPAAP